MKKNTKIPDSSLNSKANKTTFKKENIQKDSTKKDLSNDIKISNFEDNIKVIKQDLDEKKLKDEILEPKHEFNKDFDEIYKEMEEFSKEDLKDVKLSMSVNIWKDYYERYSLICKTLKLKEFKFNENFDTFDKNKDKLAEILAENFSNTDLNIVMYGAKRLMIEIMSKIKEERLNCIIFFLFTTMMDVIQLQEVICQVTKDKTFIEIAFDEFKARIEQIDAILDEKLKKNQEIKTNLDNMVDIKNRLSNLEINTMNNNILNTNMQLEIKKFIEFNKENNVKFFEYIDKLVEDKIKVIKDTKSENNNINKTDINKLYGLIRKLNARCSGLHDRILNLEDNVEELSQKSNLADSESKSDDEYEELEDGSNQNDESNESDDYQVEK